MNLKTLSSEGKIAYLIKPILKVLQEAGGQLERSEIKERIADMDDQIAEYSVLEKKSKQTGNTYKEFNFKFNFAIKDLYFNDLLTYTDSSPVTLTEKGLYLDVDMYRLKKNGRVAVILPDGFLFGTDNAKVNIKKKLLSEFNLHTIIRMPGSVFAPYTSITTNILFFDRTKPTEETWFYRMDMPEGYKHFSKTKPMKLEHFAHVVEW